MDIYPSVPAPRHVAAKAQMSVSTADTTITMSSSVATKGKASAPGQVAMSLRAEIEATGADLQVNIQGKLASSLAQGADAQSLFFAFAVSVDGAAVEEPNGAVPANAPPAIEADVEDPADEGSDPAPITGDVVDDFGLSSAKIALDLLTGTIDGESAVDDPFTLAA